MSLEILRARHIRIGLDVRSRGEGIHFLADDVGVAADGTREQFRRLEDRQADFAEAEGGENFAGGLFDVIPESVFPAAGDRGCL